MAGGAIVKAAGAANPSLSKKREKVADWKQNVQRGDIRERRPLF